MIAHGAEPFAVVRWHVADLENAMTKHGIPREQLLDFVTFLEELLKNGLTEIGFDIIDNVASLYVLLQSKE